MLGKGILFACCLAAAIVAQESQPASRPASRPAIEYRTQSGFRVRLAPVDLPGEVAVILGIQGAGMLSEPAGTPHLAHISEHGVFHSIGEDTQWGKLVAQWHGEGRANAETLPDFMYFDLYPPEGIAHGARLPIEIQYQRFVGGYSPPSVMDREIPLALSEVTGLEALRTEKLDRLGKFAWSAFTQAALRGISDVPFKSRTTEISWAMIDAFRQRTFYPGAAMLTVVGDFDPEEVRRMIDPSWLPHHREHKAEPRPKLRPGTVQGKWDVASDQFFMAWPAPPPSDPAHPALAVFAQLLQQRLSLAPAVMKLRRQPLFVFGDVGGFFAIQTPLKTANGGEALAAEIRKAIDALAADEGALRALKNVKAGLRASAGILSGPIQYPPALSRKVLAHANIELARMRATLAWTSPPRTTARAPTRSRPTTSRPR